MFHVFRGFHPMSSLKKNTWGGFHLGDGSPFRFDPRGWEPHFVATERRHQGALLTSWQNPTFTEEDFCYKMGHRFCSTRIRSHPLARFALYRMVATGGGYTRTILGSLGSNLQHPTQTRVAVHFFRPFAFIRLFWCDAV